MSSVSDTGKPKRGILSSLRHMIGGVDQSDEALEPGEAEPGAPVLGASEPGVPVLGALEPGEAGPRAAPPEVGQDDEADDDALILDPTMQSMPVDEEVAKLSGAEVGEADGVDETTIEIDETVLLDEGAIPLDDEDLLGEEFGDAGDEVAGDDDPSALDALLEAVDEMPAEAADASEDDAMDQIEPGDDDQPRESDLSEDDIAGDGEAGDGVEEADDGLIRAAAEEAPPGLSLVSSETAVDEAADAGSEDGGDVADDDGGDGDGEGAADEITAAPAATEDPDAGADEEPAAPEIGATLDPQELEDTIRRVIREELSGEMGQRLSQNLQRMIRDEVAKSLMRRG